MEPSPPYLGLILAACGKLQNFIARGCQLSPRARYDCISDEEHLDDEVTQAFGRMATTHHNPGSDTSTSSDSWTLLIMCTISFTVWLHFKISARIILPSRVLIVHSPSCSKIEGQSTVANSHVIYCERSIWTFIGRCPWKIVLHRALEESHRLV